MFRPWISIHNRIFYFQSEVFCLLTYIADHISYTVYRKQFKTHNKIFYLQSEVLDQHFDAQLKDI